MDLQDERDTLEASDRVETVKITDTGDLLVGFAEPHAYLDAVSVLDEAISNREAVEHFSNIEDETYDICIEFPE